jgi:putative ABC transport system permease protein
MHDPLTVGAPAARPPVRLRWPFARLALQNLGRRPTRAGVLALAVALGVGTAFAALVARQAVAASTTVGFGRMGADLLVVPKDTLVNVSPALLTVEPGPFTLPSSLVEEIARLPGVRTVAPQRYFRLAANGSHGHETELVAFDPQRDFTVLPWVKERSGRTLQPGNVIVGARRPEQQGSEVTLGGCTLTVYGRLALTGVGPFDRSFFASFETAARLAPGQDPDRVSAVLIQLSPEARPEQVRFALAARKDIKVISGTPLVTSVRQFLSTLLAGVLIFTGLMLLATLLQISVLYSAVLAERRQELGLLLALGAHRGQVARMVLTEAGLTTGLGGLGGLLLGVVLLLVFQHTLWKYLETLEAPLTWPSDTAMGLAALGCLVVAVAVGPLGAMLPAWRLCLRDPYNLARGGSA